MILAIILILSGLVVVIAGLMIQATEYCDMCKDFHNDKEECNENYERVGY